jgi:hypothetical protein
MVEARPDITSLSLARLVGKRPQSRAFEDVKSRKEVVEAVGS